MEIVAKITSMEFLSTLDFFFFLLHEFSLEDFFLVLLITCWPYFLCRRALRSTWNLCSFDLLWTISKPLIACVMKAFMLWNNILIKTHTQNITTRTQQKTRNKKFKLKKNRKKISSINKTYFHLNVVENSFCGSFSILIMRKALSNFSIPTPTFSEITHSLVFARSGYLGWVVCHVTS